MERVQLVAGNWKMYKTLREGTALVLGILERIDSVPPNRSLLVCPPATLLHSIRQTIADRPLLLGAQDLFWERQGAFTGQISPAMLLDAGCTHVLVGHSERRRVLGDSEDGIRRKLEAAFANGLRPVFCIGETLEERESGRTAEVLTRQLGRGFEGIEPSLRLDRLILAYEPVWAIGTGRTATPDEAQEAHAFVRKTLAGRWGDDAGSRVPILYGGSVKPDNAGDLLSLPDVDGVLVGGASLEAEAFLEIARAR